MTFHSDLLDLSFTYPGSLVAEKLPSLEEQHATIARRQPPDESPEDRKTDQCTDQALLAQRKDDPDRVQATIAIYGDKRGTVLDIGHPVTAKITISRVGVECMPGAYRDHLDTVAAAMAAGFAQGSDLKPIDHPIWYEVGRTRVHFAGAESVLAEKQSNIKQDEKKNHRWVASLTFVSNGNLVSMLIESNDLAFLNEILHGDVAIGNQAAAPLFPAGIGHGAPLQPKP